MDTFQAIATKVETRQFESRKVPQDVKHRILEAARLTGSSNNTQHWRFILINEPENIKRLASDSTSGSWVAGASFAVLIITNPRIHEHLIDAGRVLQDMQLAAWNEGVGSGIFTGFHLDRLKRDYEIPADLTPTVALGFGYPLIKTTGMKKKREALEKIAFAEKFGQDLNLKNGSSKLN